jgi:hypothetical protein
MMPDPNLLKQVLPEGPWVGTVEKFHGQKADVGSSQGSTPAAAICLSLSASSIAKTD